MKQEKKLTSRTYPLPFIKRKLFIRLSIYKFTYAYRNLTMVHTEKLLYCFLSLNRNPGRSSQQAGEKYG